MKSHKYTETIVCGWANDEETDRDRERERKRNENKIINWPVFAVAADGDELFGDDFVAMDDVSVAGFDAAARFVAGCVSVPLVDSMSALLSVFLYQLHIKRNKNKQINTLAIETFRIEFILSINNFIDLCII